MPAAFTSSARQPVGEDAGTLDGALLAVLEAGSSAILNATALAAMTCSSGPPCWPGKTADWIFLATASSLVMIARRAGARASCASWW